jgi:hypothetical protein
MNNEKRNSTSSLTAGVLGLLIGAAGTTALLLSDKELRKKMLQKLQKVKTRVEEWSNQTLEEVNESTQEAKKQLEEKVAEKNTQNE